MSRKAFLLGVVFCAGVAGTLAARAAGPFFAEEPPPIAGQPFSGVSETRSITVFADGNRIVRTNTARYFRDSQGRTRVERSPVDVDSSGALPITTITINDPVQSQRYFLNSNFKTVMVLKNPNDGSAQAQAAIDTTPLEVTAPFALLGLRMGLGATAKTESSSDTVSLGEKVVNGVLATGTRVVRTIPIGAIGNEKPITSTLERWVSSDLHVPVQMTETSSIGGTVTYNLEQISRGDPDPALFVVPADYTRHELGTAPRTATLTMHAPAQAVQPAVPQTAVTVIKP